MANTITLLCIVDYYSKFPVVKKVASLSVDYLVHTTKLTCSEFGLPRKIISDVGKTLHQKHSRSSAES